MDGAFRLGDWLVEPRLNTLASGDRDVRVEPKVMAVLVCLADRAGDVVAKEELLRAVWPDTFVTDDVLTHAISELRKVLADDARTPRFIQTIPKGGYRLIAPVARVGVPAPSLDAGGVTPRTAARRPLWNRAIALGGAVALTLLGVVAIRSRTVIPPAPHVMRLAIDNRSTGPLMAHHMSQLPSFRLSPDGTRLVFIVGPALNNPIYKRALDQTEPTPIAGTEGGIVPFFSPDGAWLGFAAKGRLKKVSLEDGTLVDLCAAPSLRGATWTSAGEIVFTPTSNSGLWRIPAGGGTPVELTALDRTRNENTHRWPESLPGGRRVIFTARRGGDMEDADLEAVDLDTGKRHLLIKGGSFGQYVPSGHLVYGRQTELLAVAFDASTLHVRSSPSRVVDGVITGAGTGSVDFSVSATGSLAYVPKAVGADERRLVSVDEKGQAEDLVAARGAYDAPRLSPDGRQVAVTVGEGSGSNVWTYDLQRGTARRATRGLRDGWSVWDPDGRHLTISANIAAARNIVAWDLEAEQSGPPLAPSAQWQWPTSWSPDGRSLAYTEYNPSSLADVWILEGDQRRPFVATAGMDTGARFSPDGRWLAYASDETGAPQVCIKPFPGPGPALQVSEGGGGDQPVWDRSAPRLYFRHGEKLFLVEMAGSPARPSKPRLVFEGAYRGAFFNHAAGYDVLPGGHRFVMIKDSERAMPKTEINLVVNWSDELARRVLPTDP